jgi:hypothetical protein
VAKIGAHLYARRVKQLLTVGLLATLAVGCHKNQDAEGPIERAGKKVDKAAEKTGRALEKAAEKTGGAAEKAAQKTGEAFEKVGEKLQGEDAPEPEKKPVE